LLTTTFTGLTLTCPTGTTGCAGFSNPLLQNNVIWQNRSFYIGIGARGTGTQNQQNLVSLFPTITQTASGQCATTGNSYWDIGVRGDSGPGNHGSGFTLNPTYSVLDDTGYAASNQTGTNPNFVAQYCNGSRVPPECSVADGCAGPSGYGVPPGIVDASTPNPVFSLTPSATVDEGNNWINVSWGPLALSNDAVAGGANGNYGGGSPFGNYALAAGSPAIDHVPVAQGHPSTDFFGNPRPDPANTTSFDVGAIEFQGGAGTGGGGTGTGGTASVSPSPLAFGTVTPGTTRTLPVTVTNTGTVALAGGTFTVGGGGGRFSRPAGAAGGTCGGALAVGATCTVNVTFSPNSTATRTGTLTVAYTAGATVTGSPVTLTGN
jgi:hypothetical protein